MRPTLNLFSTLLFLLTAANCIAQQQVSFTYDVSGNQIERKLVCVNCSILAVKDVLKDIKLFKNDSLLTGRHFLTYPNPLKEVLHVKWSSTDQSFIIAIDVFALNGVRIYHKNYASNQTETDISFLNLNAGMYVLRGIYNDGKQENVEILKQ